MRDAIIKRYKYRCYRCDKVKKKTELQLHHIMPRSEGGSDYASNLIPLCNQCHDFCEIEGFKTKAEIIGSYEDAPIREKKLKELAEKEESFERPSWHSRVYGGDR